MSEVSWLLTATIKDGQQGIVEQFAKQGVQMIAANEPGCVAHDWSITEDGKQLFVYEVYKDNEAGLAHMAGIDPQAMGMFMNLVTPTAVHVWGDISDELRSALAPMNPTFHRNVAKLPR